MGVKNATETQKKVVGRPFEKGNPGGPGRPKKEYCIPDILRKIANEQDPDTKKTKIQQVCEKAFEQAIEGNKDARGWIADRMEGKAKETIEHAIIRNIYQGDNPEEYLDAEISQKKK